MGCKTTKYAAKTPPAGREHDGGQEHPSEEPRRPGDAEAPQQCAEEGSNSAPSQLDNYVDKESLLQILRTKNVRLLRPMYLSSLHEAGKIIPRRQEVPDEAFLDVDRLTPDESEKLEVIAISYCWISQTHPDPDGFHLATLAHILRIFVDKGTPSKDKYEVGGFSAPVGSVLSRGFVAGSGDGRPVGIFLDWPCLFQEPREAWEAKAFKDALKSINIWYAHSKTTTWMLTSSPPGATRSDYTNSGWPFFESCVAGLISSQGRLLNITAEVRRRLLNGSAYNACDYLEFTLKATEKDRGAPLTPTDFDKLVNGKTFTNGADKDKVVIPKYAETFAAVVAGADALCLVGMGFSDEQAGRVLKVARHHCKALTALDLSFNQAISFPTGDWAEFVDDKGLEKLGLAGTRTTGDVAAFAKLRSLTWLRLAETSVSGDVKAFSPLTSLTVLGLDGTQVSGDVKAFSPLTSLTVLALNGTQVSGDVGELRKALRTAKVWW